MGSGGKGVCSAPLPSQGGQKTDGNAACEAVCFERPGGERLSLRKMDLFDKIKAKGS